MGTPHRRGRNVAVALVLTALAACGDQTTAVSSTPAAAGNGTRTGSAGSGGASGAAGAAGTAGAAGALPGGSAASGMGGVGLPPDDSPEALCRFEACGGDPVGDWTVDDACFGGTLGRCPVRMEGLGPGGSLSFGCDGDLVAGFGVFVDCVQTSCSCTPRRDTSIMSGSYRTNGDQLTLLPPGGEAFDVDYCVRGDELTFGMRLAALTPLGAANAYITLTARRTASSPGPEVCFDAGASNSADASFDPDAGTPP